MGSIGALIPTFLAGVMLDLLPVRAVLILIGAGLTSIAVFAWQRGGMAATRAPRQAEPEASSDASESEDQDWA
jgi:hypothetical protein